LVNTALPRSIAATSVGVNGSIGEPFLRLTAFDQREQVHLVECSLKGSWMARTIVRSVPIEGRGGTTPCGCYT
jgi:hypothetical protein